MHPFLLKRVCFLMVLDLRLCGPYGASVTGFFFSNHPPKKSLIWDTIVSYSFLWISSRNPKTAISWVGWLRNPLLFIASL